MMHTITLTEKGHTVVDGDGRPVFWSRSLSEARFVLEWSRRQSELDRPVEWSDI